MGVGAGLRVPHRGMVESPAMSYDHQTATQPAYRVRDPYADTQPNRYRRRRGRFPAGAIGFGILAGLLLGAYLLLPGRHNLLILGIDRAPEGTAAGRSDTIILTTIQPADPYVGMLSIPRDLWVQVPGVGENRINTAHFFAEANQPGSGPSAALETVESNFNVRVPFFIRIQFDGLQSFVDDIGGVPITLDRPMSGYQAGYHLLDGEQALAFVRDRAGSDDFARMERGQLFVGALLRAFIQPSVWPGLPGAAGSLIGSVDTNLPVWLWPRLGIAVLRTGPDNFDARVIDRSLATGFTTSEGAQVLAPNWPRIQRLVDEMFRS